MGWEWCSVHKKWNYIAEPKKQETKWEFQKRRPDLAKKGLTQLIGGGCK